MFGGKIFIMKKIGIICASDEELNPFLENISILKTIEKAMLKFYVGTLNNVNVIAVYSGVCKVNAAIATQLLIEIFNIDIIINAGVAGGIDKNVKLFDTIIVNKTAYHDVAEDILTEFHPWLQSIYFKANENLISIAQKYSLKSKYPILFGTIVTGEKFIIDSEREKINKKFNALAVDMETASIAHVCYVNKVPFITIRTITDNILNDGIENFEKNCKFASKICYNIVFDLIKEYNKMSII